MAASPADAAALRALETKLWVFFYLTYFILEKGNLKLVKNNKAKTILANQAKGGFS